MICEKVNTVRVISPPMNMPRIVRAVSWLVIARAGSSVGHPLADFG